MARQDAGAYEVGKVCSSIWVFLYTKLDFLKIFLYNNYTR